MNRWRIDVGDCRDALRAMPARSVHTVVTSPPYFGLRDYGTEGQIGLESTPDEFVAALVDVFRGVRRVLRDDGTVWLNLGDSYNAYNGGVGPSSSLSRGAQTRERPMLETGFGLRWKGAKPKDLLGIPWMVAFALRADGWYLRSDIVWSKPNPMPESVTDRPTKSHEYVFLLSKSARYHYDADAIREPHMTADDGRNRDDFEPSRERNRGGRTDGYTAATGAFSWPEGGRNKRSVWTVATQPYANAHFATYPPKLIEPCVLAGAPERACGVCGAPWLRVVERTPRVSWDERKAAGAGRGNVAFNGNVGAGTQRGVHGKGVSNDLTTEVRTLGFEPSCSHGDGSASGVVLDPFAGAGTTGIVALQHGREFVGIELNPEYARMARERIETAVRLGFRAPQKVAVIDGQGTLFDDFWED